MTYVIEVRAPSPSWIIHKVKILNDTRNDMIYQTETKSSILFARTSSKLLKVILDVLMWAISLCLNRKKDTLLWFDPNTNIAISIMQIM